MTSLVSWSWLLLTSRYRFTLLRVSWRGTEATAEVDGCALTDEEVISFLRLLVLAGAETTYHLMGSALYALLRDAELMARVRTDRNLVPALLDEVERLRENERVRALCGGCGADAEEGCVAECERQVYR